MPKPLEVKPLPNFRLWLRYDDGVSGEVDLSYLAGKGIFKAWDQSDFSEDSKLDLSGNFHGVMRLTCVRILST